MVLTLAVDLTTGIGAACALALAQAGASICVVQRPPSPGVEPNMDTVNSIRALGVNTQVVYCDLSNLDSVRELFPKALELMGGSIHILVNCAGIQRRSPSVDFPEKDWDDVGHSLKFCLTFPASDSQVVHVSPLILGSRREPQIRVAYITSGGPAHGSA